MIWLFIYKILSWSKLDCFFLVNFYSLMLILYIDFLDVKVEKN